MYPEAPPASAPVTTYRLDPGHVLRLFGLRLVIAAGLVLVAGVLLGFGGGAVRAAAYVLGAVALVLVVIAIVPLVRAPVVVRLDGRGYRVRRVRDCGVSAAAWTEVERVDDVRGRLGPYLTFVLADERTTYLPLVLVARQSAQLRSDVHVRLDRAHGYRRLSGDEAGAEADWPGQPPT